MQAIEIPDIKQFMKLLFQTDFFKDYDMVSAEVRTDISYSIEGKINRSFYDEDELSILQLENHQFMPWSLAREKVFTLIKGKKTPSILKLVLKANSPKTDEIIEAANSSLNPKDIDGIYINVIFQENKLNVICGISYKIFTLDKNFENIFAENFITLLKSNGIICEY